MGPSGLQVSQEAPSGLQVSHEAPSGRQVDTSDAGHEVDTFVQKLSMRLSEWSKMVRVVADVRRFVDACRKKCAASSHLSVQELKEAEVTIIKDVQRRHFASEVAAIQEKGVEVAQRGFNRSSSSPVKYLNPMVDGSGLLRVGGCLKKA